MEKKEELLCVENMNTNIYICTGILISTSMCMWRGRKQKVTIMFMSTNMNTRMSISTNIRGKVCPMHMNMRKANTAPTIISIQDMRKRYMNIKEKK